METPERERWSHAEIAALYRTPLIELIAKAAAVHRQHHRIGEVQVCALLSIKTGACSEDCAYCAQSAHYQTAVAKHELLCLDEVLNAARTAKNNGCTRFCMGAAWRQVRNNSDFDRVLEMVEAVHDEGLEVCATLGMLTDDQAKRLEQAGLYAYNHNLDTSPEFYPKIITTRTFQDRLRTLEAIRKTGITLCCGGIIGMGETDEDRIRMIHILANLSKYPESVPINALVPATGTPLAHKKRVSAWELIRMIATVRLTMPTCRVRLAAGRRELNFSEQALCFLAGANSIFAGDKLLTAPNPAYEADRDLFETLGLTAFTSEADSAATIQPPNFETALNEPLNRRRQQGTFRRLPAPASGVDFTSNDYLGLARSTELARSIAAKLNNPDPFGSLNGSTGSRLLSGNSRRAEMLEKKIAAFHQTESALLFNSGYDANLGALSALLCRGATVFYDEYCHASMHDGIRLARATAYPFKHNDPADLEQQLARIKKPVSAAWIVVESVYSMSGDQAPLRQLAELARRTGAVLFVDEAHATGVFGPAGAGLVQALNLAPEVAVRVHTFGKALGCHGAAVVGSHTLQQFLINFARPLIYSTALPSHSLAAIEAAYELLPLLDAARAQLRKRVKLFRELARHHGLTSLLDSESPIQALIFSDTQVVRELALKVQSEGFDVRPILSPTVPRGLERIRICLHACNSETEISGLVLALKNALNTLRP